MDAASSPGASQHRQWGQAKRTVFVLVLGGELGGGFSGCWGNMPWWVMAEEADYQAFMTSHIEMAGGNMSAL